MANGLPASMVDIARASGVSQPTVSRALRNHPSISPATRKKVLEAAVQLGYHPNPLVSTLMAHIRTRRQPKAQATLAYVTTHRSRNGWQTYMADFYQGARERAEAQGYTLEAFWFHEPGMNPQKFSRMLYTRNIQGVIIAPLDQPGSLLLEWRHFSAAAICYTLRNPSLSRATTSHFQNMQLLLQRLREKGYKRIGFFIETNDCLRNQNLWLSSYLGSQFHLSPRERITPLVIPQLSRDAILEWIRSKKPDAVITSHCSWARTLRDAGLDIPGDLGFASLNIEYVWAEPVAGIIEHHHLSGAATVDMVIGQIQRNERGLPEHPKLTVINGTWQDGPTVRQVA